jgi:hypothetical protein
VWGVGAEDGESRGTSHSREGRAGLPARPPQTAPREARRGGPRHTDGETARRHTSGRPQAGNGGATLGGKGVKHNRRRHFRMPGTQGMGGGRAM